MEKDIPDHFGTRIVSQRELVIGGVPFQWWAVGEKPALVTVRAPMFGSLAELTDGDVAQFAAALAKRLLTQHAAAPKKERKSERRALDWSALEKPGWFEPGSTDFTETVF